MVVSVWFDLVWFGTGWVFPFPREGNVKPLKKITKEVVDFPFLNIFK